MTDSYPGNASLPSEVKQRILTTFRQTLDLFQQGRTDEAVAGCDFLLSLDQNFGPAKKLRAQAASGAAVDITEFGAFNTPHAEGDELVEAGQALADREFQRALDLSTSILTRDFTNETAQKIAEDAREKLEAAPFIDQFIQKARKQIAEGKVDAARMSLDKARALDPNHPDIQAAEASLPQSGFGAPAFNDPLPEQPSATSFVVDPQPQEPAGRSGDFGFKFEEEPKNDFSFDNPAAFSFGSPPAGAEAPVVSAAPPSESNTFDFTTASIDISSEDQSKIDQYLQEGDDASAAGDIQLAIDLWSRIFLIDVTNDAASERIEKARGKRMELDKKVEDLMVAATLAYEKRDFATAKTKFEDVLRLDPRNFNAGEYLEKLSTQGEGAAAEAPPPSYARDNASDGLDDVYEGAAESLVPPSPAVSRERKATAKAAAAAASPGKKRSFGTILAVGAALLILAGGGWFAFSKFKPGSAQQTTAGTAEVFTRAQALARGGKFDEAIALLSTVPPKSAEHDRALVMISELKAKKAQTAGTVEGRPAQEVYRELLGQAQSAFAAHDYVGAKAAFEKASVISALPPEMMPAFQNASQQVAKLDSAQLLFKEGNYTTAIANLESLLQQDPQNLNIRHLIGDAHFNIGRTALQDGRPSEAAAAFGRTLEFRPDDEEAKRSRDLAARYEGQPPDLLYRIYVKYLPLR